MMVSSGEQAVVRIYADAPQRNSGFFGDDGSDVRYDTYVVVPHHTQCDGVLGPFGIYPPSVPLRCGIRNARARSLAFGQSQRCILIPPLTVTKPNTSSP